MAAQALRFRHVLCPTDFSPFSAHVVSHAASICRAFGSQLTIIHVHPRELPVAAEFSYLSPAPLDAAERASLESKLEALAESARATGVRAQSLLVEGDPAREVAQHAQELMADLLVLGFYDRARLKHLLMGSVTEELLRRAPCPVLTVRHGLGPAPEAGAPYQKILCGTDLRVGGDEAVSHALSLAESFAAELTLLHVLEHVPEFEPGSALQFTMAEIQTFRQAMAEDARARLRAAAPEAARERLAVRDLVKAGSAHEHILRVAREEDSRLIVLGAPGHGALERLLFGSTSRRVVREAPCPVLIVRGTVTARAEARGRARSRQALPV